MLCSNSFTSFGVYKHHIGNFHGMLIEEYRAKFGKHGEVISKITCKVSIFLKDFYKKYYLLVLLSVFRVLLNSALIW